MKADLSILPSVEDIDAAARFVMDLDLPSARPMLERMDESLCCRAFLAAAQDTVQQSGLRAVGLLVVRAYFQGMLAERSRRDRVEAVSTAVERFATGADAEAAGKRDYLKVTGQLPEDHEQ